MHTHTGREQGSEAFFEVHPLPELPWTHMDPLEHVSKIWAMTCELWNQCSESPEKNFWWNRVETECITPLHIV